MAIILCKRFNCSHTLDSHIKGGWCGVCGCKEFISSNEDKPISEVEAVVATYGIINDKCAWCDKDATNLPMSHFEAHEKIDLQFEEEFIDEFGDIRTKARPNDIKTFIHNAIDQAIQATREEMMEDLNGLENWIMGLDSVPWEEDVQEKFKPIIAKYSQQEKEGK